MELSLSAASASYIIIARAEKDGLLSADSNPVTVHVDPDLPLDPDFISVVADGVDLSMGCVQAERGKRYPICLEGARHCPPEDVGGTPGYEEFLEAIADPEHERHDEFLTWVGGSFDPEEFDADKMTKKMRRGLPDWRTMSQDWI